jgi:hypothetical protein
VLSRDTEMLPALGYLLIAFQSDNPGSWLLHCHIGWHQMTGFSMQVIDQIESIPALYNKDTLEATCSKWDSYYDDNHLDQMLPYDDGI